MRPYQEQALAEIVKRFRAGVSRQLVVWPTGTGKTCLAASLPEALSLQPWEQLLFLVHRDELVFQAAEKFSHYNPHLAVEIEKAQYHAHPNSDVIVASVQSLSRQKRLERLRPEAVRIGFVDECHHLPAEQYLAVLRHFCLLKGEPNADPRKLLIGLTATPRRTDNRGLERVFDEIVHQMSILTCIEDGWLADIDAFRVTTDHSVADVGVSRGDFVVRDLERKVNTPERNRLVVDKWREQGKLLPALAFTVDIQHSHDLAEEMKRQGYSAFALSGKTPTEQRKQAIRDYAEGRLQALVSCGVLSEGFDAPRASVGLMTRPTKSTLLYTQQIGRILRPYPSPEDSGSHNGYRKERALILDFADNAGRHKLINIATLFGLRSDFDVKGKSVRKLVRRLEELEREHPGIDLRNAADPDEIKALVEKIDLLERAPVSEEVRKHSRFSWLGTSEFGYRLPLPNRGLLSIDVNHLGQYEVWQNWTLGPTSSPDWPNAPQRVLTFTGRNAAEAFAMADQLVPHKHQTLLKRNAGWRRQPPTEQQSKELFRRDVKVRKAFTNPNEVYLFALREFKRGNAGWSRGALSDRIGTALVS